MELDDPRWKTLRSGLGYPYDASQDLRKLEAGDDRAFDALFENLHHQGDVGEASYAAVPILARIARARPKRNGLFYALANIIESGRHARMQSRNPSLPEWLSLEYHTAIREMMAMALEDILHIEEPEIVNQALATIAFAKHSISTGIVLTEYSEDELAAVIDGTFND